MSDDQHLLDVKIKHEMRIIEYLEKCREGIDDDLLAGCLGIKPRQTVNIICRKLEKKGVLIRKKRPGEKIKNYWATNAIASTKTNGTKSISSIPEKDCWFWEGNVQEIVIRFLKTKGYSIRSFANTASHEKGIDIIAVRKESELVWISVKGYPQATPHTRSDTQAPHWFKDAIFDMIQYRERSKDVHLAAAFPDFPCYRKYARKITWLKEAADFIYFWVDQNGDVSIT